MQKISSRLAQIGENILMYFFPTSLSCVKFRFGSLFTFFGKSFSANDTEQLNEPELLRFPICGRSNLLFYSIVISSAAPLKKRRVAEVLKIQQISFMCVNLWQCLWSFSNHYMKCAKTLVVKSNSFDFRWCYVYISLTIMAF